MARKTYDPASQWIKLPATSGETRVFTVDRVVEYRSEGSGSVVTIRNWNDPAAEDIQTPEALAAFEERFFVALRSGACHFGGANQLCGRPY